MWNGIGIYTPSLMASGGYSAGQFKPTQLANCLCWLRPDPQNITLNGTDVSAIVDMSGNGNGATQSTPAIQPLYVASDSDLNGHPSIDCSSAGDRLALTCDPGGASAMTVVCVVKPMSFTGSFTYPWDANGVDRTIFVLQAAGNTSIFDGAAFRGAAAATTVAQVLVYTVNTNDMVIRRNGVEIGTFGTYALRHCKDGNVFNTGTTDRSKFAELIIYNRELTAAEISDVETYATARYDL